MSVRNKGGVNVGEGSDHDCMLPKTCAKFNKDYMQSLSKLQVPVEFAKIKVQQYAVYMNVHVMLLASLWGNPISTFN